MAPLKMWGEHTTALEVVQGLDLSGKTFFITGGNAGKGFQTARALALCNGHVVLGCRNMVHGLEARGDILEEKRDAKIDILQMDNADLQSIKDCADKYISKGWPLHCLILNTAVFDPLHRITDDEFESTFQINHLAHFYLIQLLTPVLIQSAPSRVVVVSSDGHRYLGQSGFSSRDICWERLSPTHTHQLNSALVAYNLSQMCNILFANALHHRLSQHGIIVNTANPGLVRTSIEQSKSKLLRSLLLVAKPWMKSAEQASSTIVYCAVSHELTEENGGRYFENCHPKSPCSYAQNVEMADRVWDNSQFMIQTYLEKHQRTCAKIERSSTGSGLHSISEDHEVEILVS